jgi:hypothetical protein
VGHVWLVTVYLNDGWKDPYGDDKSLTHPHEIVPVGFIILFVASLVNFGQAGQVYRSAVASNDIATAPTGFNRSLRSLFNNFEWLLFVLRVPMLCLLWRIPMAAQPSAHELLITSRAGLSVGIETMVLTTVCLGVAIWANQFDSDGLDLWHLSTRELGLFSSISVSWCACFSAAIATMPVHALAHLAFIFLGCNGHSTTSRRIQVN